MTLFDRLALLSALDAAALSFLMIAWLASGWLIEHPPASRPSVTPIMSDNRRAWMKEMVTRTPRIFDAQILSTLRQGTAFFASTCMILLGGTLALISDTASIAGVAEDFTENDHSEVIWEIKLMVPALFLTNAFLKFVWANRLFGYCAVLMAAVPNDATHEKVYHRASQSAEINVTAARSFNRGLRSIYFALASAGWLVCAWVLIGLTLLTCVVIWRREFASESRKVLLDR